MCVDYRPDRWMSKAVLCMSDSLSSVSGICKITWLSDSDCIFLISAKSLVIRREHMWLLVFDTVDIVDIKLGTKILFVWLKVLRRKQAMFVGQSISIISRSFLILWILWLFCRWFFSLQCWSIIVATVYKLLMCSCHWRFTLCTWVFADTQDKH